MTRLPQPGRTLVMGILNVTPDSFSDGGEFLATDAAVRHGLDLHADGADLVDVGGESTRPGAVRADPQTELARVVPVIEQLTRAGVPVSIDTMRAEVAVAAVAAGAVLVNDVSGGLADSDMLAAVADLDAGYVAMHWRGHAQRMAELATYSDVVSQVVAGALRQIGWSDGVRQAPGLRPEADHTTTPDSASPRTATHNGSCRQRLERSAALGQPLLIGASRKRSSASCAPTVPRRVRSVSERTPVSRSPRWWPRPGCGEFGRTPLDRTATRSLWLPDWPSPNRSLQDRVGAKEVAR